MVHEVMVKVANRR